VTEKLRVDIPILLPGVPDADDACVARLTSEIQSREGVEAVHVAAGGPDEPAQLCIHYDPEIVPLPRIRKLVASAGATITDQFGHVLWQVEGIGHQRRARTVADRLRAVAGVLEAEASAAGLVRVEFDRTRGSEQAIRDALAGMGITVASAVVARRLTEAPERVGEERAARENGDSDHVGHDHGDGKHDKDDGHDHSHGGLLGTNTELIFSVSCGGLLGAGIAIEKLVATAPGWLPTACYVAAYFFGGFYTLREAIDNLRLKKFEIDTLMLVAAAGAAALGAFAEGALLLFLFSLGHALEHYAMGRAKQAIEALAELAPRTATVRRDGDTREVPVEDLVIGDVVVVRPNERLPADGFLVKGETSVNQAPVTGESIPVDKRPVEERRNGARQAKFRGFIVARVRRHHQRRGCSRSGGDAPFDRDRAWPRSCKWSARPRRRSRPPNDSPTSSSAFSCRRCWRSLSSVLFAWVVIDEPFSDSFYRAMAVLVAASPCALAIATPSAVLSGVARAARAGVSGEGRRPAGKSRLAERHRLRQDRHADGRSPAHHRYRPG
jgi:Cd2+/Zn2+-exporting ATPase